VIGMFTDECTQQHTNGDKGMCMIDHGGCIKKDCFCIVSNFLYAHRPLVQQMLVLNVRTFVFVTLYGQLQYIAVFIQTLQIVSCLRI
jgi:hypothetical protein